MKGRVNVNIQDTDEYLEIEFCHYNEQDKLTEKHCYVFYPKKFDLVERMSESLKNIKKQKAINNEHR